MAIAEPRFAHLSVRSIYSFREGAIRLDELAARVRALGMRRVAVTDTNNLYGATRFAQACAAEGVTPVFGARVTVAAATPGTPAATPGTPAATPGTPAATPGTPAATPRPGRARTHPAGTGRFTLTLLARDRRGYANLCRIITAAHASGERGDPCASAADVARHAEGLVCLLGPESDVGRLLSARAGDLARDRMRAWLEAFGTRRLAVEVRNLLEPGWEALVARSLALAEDAGVRAVATNAARVLDRADGFLADALDAMRKLVPVADHHRDNRTYEATLKSPAEMGALFPGRPDLLENAWRVAEECDVAIETGRPQLPAYPLPRGVSPNEVLARRCWEGIARRAMPATRRLRERLDAELAMTAKLGFSGYFLTIADIADRIRAMGVRSACRGSGAGSLICYLTGISNVDPLEHGLLFERFVNEHRVSEPPDIDIDVESARREDVYRAILDAFPPERVGCAAMLDTYRARGAIREVGKALGYPEGEVGMVAKSFPHVNAGSIREALDHLPELRRSALRAGQLELLFSVAERLGGFPRHVALHPSGILIVPDDLADRAPLERSAQGFRMAQLDKEDCAALGLLKLDVLGVRMLSSMTHAVAEIERATAERVDLDSIPLDDPETFRLIRESRTLGCFQIESPGQRELLGKFEPTVWRDLIVDISLFRPGPVKSDMVSPYLSRRHGFERPFYAHPALRPFLRETFGVIVFHEQVMQAVAAVAGVDLGTADRVRRTLEDTDDLPEIERWFFDCGRANGWRDGEIAAVWREVASFAAFGFCKAHAAAFAVPTYQSSWLKAHHPAAFYAGVLTHEPGMYPRRAILDDARHHGVAILPLDVNASGREYTVEPATAAGGAATLGVRIGLMHVEGISDAEAASILAARGEKPFQGLVDLCRRTAVSRPVVENLIHAGALDAFGARRDLLVRMTDLWDNREPKREAAQTALAFGEQRVEYGLRGYTDAERVRAEIEVLGMDASRHIVSFSEPVLRALRVTRASELLARRQGARVMVAGVKVATQTPAIRSGQRIIFVTLDDGSGLIDATVFESVQERCAHTVFHSWMQVIRGTVRRTGARGISINCERAWDLGALEAQHRDGTLDARALWEEGVEEIEAQERERRLARRGRGAAAPAPRAPAAAIALPAPPRPDAAEPPRKLWHASGGSAGA